MNMVFGVKSVVQTSDVQDIFSIAKPKTSNSCVHERTKRIPAAIARRGVGRFVPGPSPGRKSSSSSSSSLLQKIALIRPLSSEDQKDLLVRYRNSENAIDRILCISPQTSHVIIGLLPKLGILGRLSDIFHMDKKPINGKRYAPRRNSEHYRLLCDAYLEAYRGYQESRNSDCEENVLNFFLAMNLTCSFRSALIDRMIKMGREGTCIHSAEALPELEVRLSERQEIRNLVEESNLRLVLAIARRMRPLAPFMELGDLVSEGTIGLRRAVEKFDPSLGNRFSTYAIWWIRQSISRAIDEKSRFMRFPVGVSQSGAAAPKEGGFLSEGAGDQLSPPEIVSLDDSIAGAEDVSLRDVITGDDVDSIEENISQIEISTILQEAMKKLSEREQLIVRARFGIGGCVVDIRSLAQQLGITPERIRQIERSAIQKLAACPQMLSLREYLS